MCLKRAVRCALAAALLFAAAPSGAEDRSVTLSIPQARSAALAAYSNGDYALAIQLAKGLLQADPEDPQAYYIIAHAYSRLGDAGLSRRAAGYAFRYSDHELDRYNTAQLAARMALKDERHTLAQYWLRRSYDYVPNERLRKQAVADFKLLRAQNPWTVQLGFSVDPSDNVNSGAQDPVNDIDGLDTTPLDLTPSALALSGTTVNARVNGAYRLSRSRNAETHLQFHASTRQVILSREARQQLQSSPFPSEQALTGADFSSIYAKIGLSHAFRLGTSPEAPKGNGYGRLRAAYAESWYSGQRYFRAYSLEAERGFRLSGSRNLSLAAEVTRRNYDRPNRESTTGELSAVLRQDLAGGDQLALGLSVAETESDYGNFRKRRAALHLGYDVGRKIGPAKLSFVIGASLSEYPEYRLLTGLFTLTTLQREDKSLFGGVTVHFEDYGFAGFAPTLSLRGRKTESNVGRFDTEEMTLSIGLRSNF
ncbi:surface lipoprotein assembly modifier [Marimonas arenosa]|uniref:Surface lipoprotein assembly modifier n=1 Tax=Marimonas arenosa TaxID=1795305 RepID=A0AAE3WCH9_9RHOB|nr:surface lipoprotein assembly modifier [Marimonas arenosa]